MEINFADRELFAIAEMAHELDLTNEKVVIQAVRMYQLLHKNILEVHPNPEHEFGKLLGDLDKLHKI